MEYGRWSSSVSSCFFIWTAGKAAEIETALLVSIVEGAGKGLLHIICIFNIQYVRRLVLFNLWLPCLCFCTLSSFSSSLIHIHSELSPSSCVYILAQPSSSVSQKNILQFSKIFLVTIFVKALNKEEQCYHFSVYSNYLL
jgi:hypothetical protein